MARPDICFTPPLPFGTFELYGSEAFKQRFENCRIDGFQCRLELHISFALILDERVTLAVTPEADTLFQMVHLIQMFFP